MARGIENYPVLHFKKAIIGANHIVMPVKKENVPSDFKRYKDKNASFQNGGSFMINEKIRQRERHLD
ncbi:MAG: hypothetical protein ACYCSO_04575 [Cuniculiplasma sp.]